MECISPRMSCGPESNAKISPVEMVETGTVLQSLRLVSDLTLLAIQVSSPLKGTGGSQL